MNQQQNDKFVLLKVGFVFIFFLLNPLKIFCFGVWQQLCCSFYRVRDITKRMKLSHTFITWYLVKIAMAYALQVITLRFIQSGS